MGLYLLFQGVTVFENSGAVVQENLTFARLEKAHTLYF